MNNGEKLDGESTWEIVMIIFRRRDLIYIYVLTIIVRQYTLAKRQLPMVCHWWGEAIRLRAVLPPKTRPPLEGRLEIKLDLVET